MNKTDDLPAHAPRRSLPALSVRDTDIRGETVHLGDAYRDIIALHQYAPAVSKLLGEFMAAAVLLSTTLKFEGKLILQARSEGQIPLLMVECTSALEIRAIARGADQATSTNFDQLLSKGQLVITIDPDQGQRYQGIVPLIGDSLAHSLDSLLRAFRAVENAGVACRRRAARSGTAAATATAATDRRYCRAQPAVGAC